MKNETVEMEKLEGKAEFTVVRLFWWARVMTVKALAVVSPAASSSCVYACAHCHTIIFRDAPDLPKNSVLCVSCKSEIFLRKLEKYDYSQACSC